MTRGKVQYLILVHSDDTRSMIPASWTDLSASSDKKFKYQAAHAVSSTASATINDLITLRKKVDFLLQRALTIRKENTDACRTDDPIGSNGTSNCGEANMEQP
jgi:hypothetical protein